MFAVYCSVLMLSSSASVIGSGICPPRRKDRLRFSAIAHHRQRAGTLASSGPRPSAIVRWAITASRRHRIGQFRQHRSLYRGHDLAGLGTDHREADNMVIIAHQDFHEALLLVGRLGPQRPRFIGSPGWVRSSAWI